MTNRGPLHPEAWADLQKSGVTADSVVCCEIAAVPPRDLNDCGIPGVAHALAFPYYTLDGKVADLVRWKLFYEGSASDRPKYWQPKGSDPLLYLPPLCDWQSIASDATKPLILTEGEKKGIAACQLGLAAVAVAGVWNWRARLDTGERLILPYT